MKARAFEEAFDQGQDLSLYLDLSQARRPHPGANPGAKNAKATAVAFPQGGQSWVNPAAHQAGGLRHWFLRVLQWGLGPKPPEALKMARIQTA